MTDRQVIAAIRKNHLKANIDQFERDPKFWGRPMWKSMCPRCQADPKPEGFGDPRKCAFDADGNFTADNWNCATIDALIGTEPVARKIQGHNDDRFEYTPTCLDDDDITGGWVITTRYKRRGCTSSAIVLSAFEEPKPLTLALSERIIAARSAHDESRRKRDADDPRKEQFRERTADLMIAHGPDRHCDGYEIIADTLWDEFVSW